MDYSECKEDHAHTSRRIYRRDNMSDYGRLKDFELSRFVDEYESLACRRQHILLPVWQVASRTMPPLRSFSSSPNDGTQLLPSLDFLDDSAHATV
jgi:hypothetical protein